MAARRTCAECGAPFSGEEPVCSCAGPPTEPGPVRPYVDLPDHGSPPAGGRAGPVPDLTPFAECGTDGTAEIPVVTGAGGAGARRSPSRRGRHGRRRPVVLLSAAAAVLAVAAGVVVVESTGGDDGEHRVTADDRDLPGGPSGLPSPVAPQQKKSPEGGSSPSPSRTTGSSPSRSAEESPSSSKPAERNGPSASPSGGAGSSSAPAERRSTAPEPSRTPERSAAPSGRTLSPGDSGEAVHELRMRLQMTGHMQQEVPTRSDYSPEVRDAVARYQSDRGITGDEPGIYGPATREALERETGG